jgi:hypothetical protein
MAISRPLLLALIGVALLAATVMAVQSSRNATSDETAVVEEPAPQQAQQPAPQGKELTPKQVMQSLSSSTSVKSGRFSLGIQAEASAGGEEQRADIDVTGVFQTRGKAETPQFDIDFKLAAPDGNVNVGAVSTGDRAFLTSGDKAYALPRAAWSEVTAVRRKAAQQSGGKPAQTQAAAVIPGFDTSDWVTDVKSEGVEQVGGVAATHVSLDIDGGRVIDDVLAVARASGQAPAIPTQVRGQLDKVVKDARVDLYVGNQDRVLRRASVAVDVQVPKELGGQAGSARIAVDYELTGANQPQSISAPVTVEETPVRDAFDRQTDGVIATGLLGVGALYFDAPAGLANLRASGFSLTDVAQPSAAAASTDNPKRVARAIEAHRPVVIFFHNPKGLDDQATAEAVRAFDRRSGVQVFTDRVESVDRYGELVSNLGVSQSPSIVIVDGRGQARLIEGYIDAETLAQEVADAR